jgi:hypothetical protein
MIIRLALTLTLALSVLTALASVTPLRAFDLHGQAFTREAIVRYLKLLGYYRGPTHAASSEHLQSAMGDYLSAADLPPDAATSDLGMRVLVSDLALDWAMKRGLAWRESVHRVLTRYGTLTIESFHNEASDPHVQGRVQRFYLADKRILVRPTQFFLCCDVDRSEEGATDRLVIAINRRFSGCRDVRRELLIDHTGAREIPVSGCATQFSATETPLALFR